MKTLKHFLFAAALCLLLALSPLTGTIHAADSEALPTQVSTQPVDEGDGPTNPEQPTESTEDGKGGEDEKGEEDKNVINPCGSELPDGEGEGF